MIIQVTGDDDVSPVLPVLQVIFMVGNKSDLEAQRDVTYEEAKQFADENGLYLLWVVDLFQLTVYDRCTHHSCFR